MAVTSIWRVNGWLGKVVVYVENPEKTSNPEFYENGDMTERECQELDDVIAYAVSSRKTELHKEDSNVLERFVSGVNCHPATARAEMMAVKKRFGKEDGTIAYHGYQSFAPGEATPEMAHKIGVEVIVLRLGVVVERIGVVAVLLGVVAVLRVAELGLVVVMRLEFELLPVELLRLGVVTVVEDERFGVVVLIVITAVTGQTKETITVDIASAVEEEAPLEEEQEQEIEEVTPPEETVEMQFDAAVSPVVGQQKFPGSKVAGHANLGRHHGILAHFAVVGNLHEVVKACWVLWSECYHTY